MANSKGGSHFQVDTPEVASGGTAHRGLLVLYPPLPAQFPGHFHQVSYWFYKLPDDELPFNTFSAKVAKIHFFCLQPRTEWCSNPYHISVFRICTDCEQAWDKYGGFCPWNGVSVLAKGRVLLTQNPLHLGIPWGHTWHLNFGWWFQNSSSSGDQHESQLEQELASPWSSTGCPGGRAAKMALPPILQEKQCHAQVMSL